MTPSALAKRSGATTAEIIVPVLHVYYIQERSTPIVTNTWTNILDTR